MYPLERQGANGHLVRLSFLLLGLVKLVKGPRPESETHCPLDGVAYGFSAKIFVCASSRFALNA